MSGDHSQRLLDEIHGLAAAFPVPHPSWHGYVPEMRACLGDLARVLEVAAGVPEVIDLVERALDGELEEGFDAQAAPAALAAAYQRLGRLPIPAGRHPYLDEIVPALEALEALLVAVSLVPAARDAFAEAFDPSLIKQRSMI
jgi:hypothetical protein